MDAPIRKGSGGVVSGLAEGLEEGVVAAGCCRDQKPCSCLATIEWEHVPLGNRIEILLPADR